MNKNSDDLFLAARVMGFDTSPKPKWIPKWAWRLKQRRKNEKAIMGWEPVDHQPDEQQIKVMIAQELRDFAELILGYSHIDPEKSAIPRSNRRVNGNKWLAHFKYQPPKQKTPRQLMREVNKRLKGMGIKT